MNHHIWWFNYGSSTISWNRQWESREDAPEHPRLGLCITIWTEPCRKDTWCRHRITQDGSRNSVGTSHVFTLEGYTKDHSYIWIWNVYFLHAVMWVSCGFCCGSFVCLFNMVACYLALAEAYENGFIVKSFNLGIYNEKSLIKFKYTHEVMKIYCSY